VDEIIHPTDLQKKKRGKKMMTTILEALATFGFLFVTSAIGGIIVVALVLAWETIKEKREKKKNANRYYKGYRRG
jgi:hypothetical protein